MSGLYAISVRARKMQITLMKGKIHRASVTDAELHYEGSISFDRTLMDAAGFVINERVEIYNIETGARFATYVIEAPRDSAIIGLNGAAARLALPGDKSSSSRTPPLMSPKQRPSSPALCWWTKKTAFWHVPGRATDELELVALEENHVVCPESGSATQYEFESSNRTF